MYFFNSGCAVEPYYCPTYKIDWDKLRAKSERAAQIMEEFYAVSHMTGGWTHYAPNYKRILKFYIEEKGMNFWSARLFKKL